MRKKRRVTPTGSRRTEPVRTLEEDVQINDDELANETNLDFFADVDSNKWRIETRTYTKQNGVTMLYYNYRQRKGQVNENGRRVIPYRKGGKRKLQDVEKTKQ